MSKFFSALRPRPSGGCLPSGLPHFTGEPVSVPYFFGEGRRESLITVNRLCDVFQGALCVGVPRCSRFMQPTKRIGKRRATGLLLSDALSKLTNSGTSHSRHLLRLLGDECQPDEAEGSRYAERLSTARRGAFRPASARPPSARVSARSSCSLAFLASPVFRAGVVVFAAKRLYRAASRWWNSTKSDFRTTIHPQTKRAELLSRAPPVWLPASASPRRASQ